MRGEQPPASFAALLRRYRRAAGLTQEALAEQARLSWRAVSDLERGVKRSPHRETVALLADALGMDGEARGAFEAAARPASRAHASGLPAPTAEPESPPVEAPTTWLPTGCYLGAAPPTRMVAREVESARVMAALHDAAAGQGRLVLVAGEPGVGKTRLAQEIMLHARDTGFVVLIGRCYEEHTSSPFFPFLEAMGTAWAAAPPTLREEAARRYRDLGRLLQDALLPVPPAGDESRPRVLNAVAGFLRDLAVDAPLALLFDDLHWVDSASLDLLLHLVRALHGQRTFLLGSYRDMEVTPGHPLANAIANLVREGLVEIVAVSPLSPLGTAEQIGAHFGMARVSEDLAALVHERTAGNPFFTAEVLKALVEQGAIYQEGERWERVAIEEMQAPASLQAVVDQRVARLSPAAQDLLRLASVLGQEFELEVLLAAADQEEAEVLAEMDAVLAARLVEERRYGRHERYAFVHALVARVLYDELPRYRLRRLHLRAAEALERARGERLETAAEVARHFLAGGEDARAVGYLELAGDHAARLYVLDEAAGYYRSALDIRQRGGDRLSAAIMQRKLGAVLATAMKFEEARGMLDTARVSLEEAGDRTELALVHHALARSQGMDARARAPYYAHALDLWPAEREDHTLLQLVLGMAEALGPGIGDFAAAAPYYRRATLLAQRLGSIDAQFNIVFQETMARFEQGTPATALLTLLDHADVVVRRAGELSAGALFAWFRGYTQMTAGNLRVAKAQFAHVVAIAAPRIMPSEHAQGVREGAYTALLLGEYHEARNLFAQARVLHPIDLHDQLYCWASGDYDGTLTAAQRGIVNLRQHQSIKYLIGTLSYLADACIELGLPREAERHAREALGLMRAHTLWMHTALMYGPLAEAVAVLGSQDADAMLAEAAAGIAHYEHDLARPQLLRARAVLLAGRGSADQARAALRESVALAREQGAVVQLARTLAVLADVARAAGDEPAAYTADAERRAIVTRIGPAVRGLVWAR